MPRNNSTLVAREKHEALKTLEDKFLSTLSGPDSEFAAFEKLNPTDWQCIKDGLDGLLRVFSKGALGGKKTVMMRVKAETKDNLEQMSKEQGKSQTQIIHEALRFHQLVSFISDTQKQYPQFNSELPELWAKFVRSINSDYRLLMVLE